MAKTNVSGLSKGGGTKSEFDMKTDSHRKLIESDLRTLRDAEEELASALDDYHWWENDYSVAQEEYERAYRYGGEGSTDYEKQDATERLSAAKGEYQSAERRLKEARRDYLVDIKRYDTDVEDLNSHLGTKDTSYYRPSDDIISEHLDFTRGWKTHHRKHRW